MSMVPILDQGKLVHGEMMVVWVGQEPTPHIRDRLDGESRYNGYRTVDSHYRMILLILLMMMILIAPPPHGWRTGHGRRSLRPFFQEFMGSRDLFRGVVSPLQQEISMMLMFEEVMKLIR